MGTPFGDFRIARIGGAALEGARRRSAATATPSAVGISDGAGVVPVA
jgi:hypothetical protein